MRPSRSLLLLLLAGVAAALPADPSTSPTADDVIASQQAMVDPNAHYSSNWLGRWIHFHHVKKTQGEEAAQLDMLNYHRGKAVEDAAEALKAKEGGGNPVVNWFRGVKLGVGLAHHVDEGEESLHKLGQQDDGLSQLKQVAKSG